MRVCTCVWGVLMIVRDMRVHKQGTWRTCSSVTDITKEGHNEKNRLIHGTGSLPLGKGQKSVTEFVTDHVVYCPTVFFPRLRIYLQVSKQVPNNRMHCVF